MLHSFPRTMDIPRLSDYDQAEQEFFNMIPLLELTPPTTPLEEDIFTALAVVNSNYGELEETHDTPPATSLDTDATDVLTLLCQEDVLTHPAVTAGEELETPHNTPPATLPATDVLTLLGLEDVLTHPAVTASDTESQICPVPGCEKRVRRVWNHVFEYHRRKGTYSGKFTCTSKYMYVLFTCLTMHIVY